MPFKITKIPKKLGASNKPQTLHENTIASSLPSPIQVLIGGMVTRPFIDRLVITMTVPDATDGIGMYNAHMLLLGDNGTYVSQRPPAGYKRAGKLILESVPNPKKWPFYAFTWKSGPVDIYGAKATFITKLRLEFVPVDLGPQGMLDLHAALSSVMDGGYSYLVKHGRISRIDIAIDLPKLHMDQFLLLPHQQLTTTQWSSKGQLQSLQYGKAQSSHTMIYDRWAKRKGKGQPTAGKEGVRIERRLKDPKLKLADLYTLPFPFKEIAIEQMSAIPPEGEKKPYLWSYFQCAVQKKGLTAALGELPVSKRTQYRKYMEQHKVEWWNPAAIWAGWKPMLDKLKIADPHGFT